MPPRPHADMSTRQVIKSMWNHWFDSWCGSMLLCSWERHFMLFTSRGQLKQSTHCGGPAWLKPCKWNSYCSIQFDWFICT